MMLCATVLVGSAAAQEAIFTGAATQPGVGIFKLRVLPTYAEYSSDPTGAGREASEFTFDTTLYAGLTPTLSASLEVPLRQRVLEGMAGEERDWGVGDLTLDLKYRFHTQAYGPIDTERIAAVVGLEIPSYDDTFSSESFNPAAGVIYTRIRGRHGWNAEARYTLTTGGERGGLDPGKGPADLLEVNASYLYRLAPAKYEADTFASWYGILEMNADWETNGDHGVFLSPGLLYEARNVGLEAGVQIPLVQDADDRFEKDWAVVFGVRVFF